MAGLRCDSCFPIPCSFLQCGTCKVTCPGSHRSQWQSQGLIISPLYLQEDTWYMMDVNLSQCGLSLTKVEESFLHLTSFKSAFYISSNHFLQRDSVIK